MRKGAPVAGGQQGTKHCGAACATVFETLAGGAQRPAHSGQSILSMDFSPPLPPWFADATFMACMAAQCGASDAALTNGDAMDTPRKSANHTSTRRVIRWALRKVCMEGLSKNWGYRYMPKSPSTRMALVRAAVWARALPVRFLEEMKGGD